VAGTARIIHRGAARALIYDEIFIRPGASERRKFALLFCSARNANELLIFLMLPPARAAKEKRGERCLRRVS